MRDALSVLEPRFAAIHTLTEIKGTKRVAGRFPGLADLSDGDRDLALDEVALCAGLFTLRTTPAVNR